MKSLMEENQAMPRIGSNIYKRKDGRWEARYIKAVLPNGKKLYGSVYARTYKEVRQKQLQCINSQRLVIKSHIPDSFAELMLIWLISRTNEIKRNMKVLFVTISLLG